MTFAILIAAGVVLSVAAFWRRHALKRCTRCIPCCPNDHRHEVDVLLSIGCTFAAYAVLVALLVSP